MPHALAQLQPLFDDLRRLPREQWPRRLEELALGETTRAELAELLRCLDLAEAESFLSRTTLLCSPKVPDDALIGQRIGPYVVHELVGRGGMGSVYRAERTDDYRQPVAIKVIHANLAHEESYRRFRDERQVLADLRHPRIARLLDGGVLADGRPYLVMEYVAGQRIDRHADDRQLTIRDRVKLLSEAVDAMAFAHQRGVIHRDLKPSNVIVADAGEAYVVDFGLARRLGEESDRTLSSAVLGTPDYMAPEQAAGKARLATPAADVHALGTLLYVLCTGRTPFRSDETAVTLRRIVEEEPVAPRRLNPAVPRDLETVCLKCLEKNPDRRYPTARELGEDLRRFLASEPVRARRAPAWRKALFWTKRRPFITALASLIPLAALGTVAAWDWSNRRADEARRAERAAALVASLQTVSTDALPDVIDQLRQCVPEALAAIDAASRDRANDARQAMHLDLAKLSLGASDKPSSWWAERIVTLPPRQAGIVARALQPRASGVAPILRLAMAEPYPAHATGHGASLADTDLPMIAVAKRRSLACLGLFILGHEHDVWPMLQHGADPRVRTYLIHYFSRSNVPARILLDALGRQRDAGVVQALLLGIAEYHGVRDDSALTRWSDVREGTNAYPIGVIREESDFEVQGLAKAEKQAFRAMAWELLRSHPDAGVHSAARWVLRDSESVSAIDQEERQASSVMPPPDKSWWVTPSGHVMAIVRGPITTEYGPELTEWCRDPKSESMGTVQIPRTFAISITEVTFAQFARFQPERAIDRFSWRADCPATHVTWYDAIAYCRWLSIQEGIPEDQLCYPPVEDVKRGVLLPTNWIERTGYRLPSNAEWEHAARGGARTRFPYGSDKTFLKYYAPYGDAVDYDRTMPVGKLKPNAHGLFDVIGNVDEWCQDEFASFAGETELDYVDLHGGIVNPGRPRVLRGGSFSTGTAWHRLRTAVRRGMHPEHSFGDVGFRIVRTVK